MSSDQRSFRATRRRFIQGAAAAAAFSVSRVGRGAAERLGVGFIGAGVSGRYACHGRSRFRLPDRIFFAMAASSRIWKSNIPAQAKSAPFSKTYRKPTRG